MKGIILAGGKGTRLSPLTNGISKHLAPVYNKPMIYYSLSVLLLAEIRDICIITNKEHISSYKNLLGNGNKFGVSIEYKIQEKPNGLPESFIIAEEFIENKPCCLILGDNFFFGSNLKSKLIEAKNNIGATIFSQTVKHPSEFGVVSLDKKGIPLKIIEKPSKFIGNDVVTGLYFYDEEVVNEAKSLTPSQRNELEITDLNNKYLEKEKLNNISLGRGIAWLDMGTFSDLMRASQFVETIENRQGLMIACLEEIGIENDWISIRQVKQNLKNYPVNEYSRYILEKIDSYEKSI